MGVGRGQKKTREGRTVRRSRQQDIIDARAILGGYMLYVERQRRGLFDLCTYAFANHGSSWI